jgi:hypothetical protein
VFFSHLCMCFHFGVGLAVFGVEVSQLGCILDWNLRSKQESTCNQDLVMMNFFSVHCSTSNTSMLILIRVRLLADDLSSMRDGKGII